MNNKIVGILVCTLLITIAIPVTGHVKEIYIGEDSINKVSPQSNGDKWMKTFGGKGLDQGFSVLQADDGGYIVAGRTYSTEDPIDWLIKTDSKGNMIWDKTYGEKGYARSVKQTSDGGYIILGKTFSKVDGSSDVWLVKIDSNSNMMWNNTFDIDEPDYGYEVIQTYEGGYMLTTNNGLIKTDSEGNKIWSKAYGGLGMSVKQTSDGGYIIAGSTNKQGAGSFDLWLLKTDSEGEFLWDKTFGEAEMDWGYSVQITNDGGYIITGFKGGTDNTIGDDAWLIKTDSDGELLWDKTYGRKSGDIGHSVQQTDDGGYIIAGSSYKFPSLDGLLIKTNSDGNEEWARYIGGLGRDEFTSVQQSNDGGYILTGFSGQIDMEVWLVKTDSSGNVPRNRAVYNSLFLRFLEQFPLLERFLNLLIN